MTPVPDHESARKYALDRDQSLDTPPDGTFDRITTLVARLLRVPVAIVSLVDTDRIWFKSHHGLDITQIDREPGLCASAILGQGPYVVADAALDPRTLVNPLVAGDFGLRSYAAVPLRTQDGFNLGTLCCLDFKPRDFNADERATLECLAAVVMDQMELRLAARRVDELHRDLKALNHELQYRASHDALTGLLNRGAIMELMRRTHADAKRHTRSLSVLMLDVDHFKRINDGHGHPAGDEVLKAVAQRLQGVLRAGDAVGRMGGEEFVIMLDHCDELRAQLVAERCRSVIADSPIPIQGERVAALDVTLSVGAVLLDPQSDLSPQDAVRQADAALYHSKRSGRNQVTLAASTCPAPAAVA